VPWVPTQFSESHSLFAQLFHFVKFKRLLIFIVPQVDLLVKKLLQIVLAVVKFKFAPV
jgi:hypothetical protein